MNGKNNVTLETLLFIYQMDVENIKHNTRSA